MKLCIVFAAVLAVSLAREIEKIDDSLEDLEAEATNVELLRTDRETKETLETAAATYNNNYIPPSQRPPRPWDQHQTQNYIPSTPQNQNYFPPAQNTLNTQVYYPQNNYVPSAPVTSVQNDYYQHTPAAVIAPSAPAPVHYPQNNYQPTVPQNTYPQNTYPQNNYQPTLPQNTYPQNNYKPTIPQNTYPQNNYKPSAPQNDAQQTPQNNYPAVIKNEQNFGENGVYNYEYQIADGTHVSEHGWLNYPGTDHESVVKKGWYSYPGADGRIYTVTWWADDSGYHAFGDHLPTPPPVHPAIQSALDQAAKEEAQKSYSTTPSPVNYPTPNPQQTYPHHTYPQQTYPQYPQQTYPTQAAGK